MKNDLIDCFQDLPCHIAAFHGDLENLQNKCSEKVNELDERGLTPLHVAILSHNLDCASYLIENGADLNMQTIVPLSSRDDQDRDRVKSIFYKKNITEWDLNIQFDKRITALHLAAALGQEETVLLLCKHKAKVNQRTHGGASALHYAALVGNSAIVTTLLQFKAKVNYKIKSQSVYGWYDSEMTALHAAAQSGSCDVINMLLTKSTNLNEKTKEGCTLIFFAARSNNFEAVKLLLESGATPQTDNPKYHNDPMTECILRSDTNSAELIINNLKSIDGIATMEGERQVFLWQPPIRMAIRYQNHAIIKMLLDAGATKPRYKDIDDAMYWGDISEVSKLYDSGKRPKDVGFSGYSHLYEAVHLGHVELVSFLLANGYDKIISEQEESSNHKNTPLHVATLALISSTHPLEQELHWKRSYKIAEILLKNGADPNAVNYFGNTPLHRPTNKGDSLMVDLLIKYGAKTELVK